MLLILSAFLLFLSLALLGNDASVLMLFASQLFLLIDQIRRGQVSGVGGFIFMSFLFFGMRPLHLLMESDYDLWTDLFLISVDLKELSTGMWWGTCGMLCFALGAEAVLAKIPRSEVQKGAKTSFNAELASDRMASLLVVYQLCSLVVMYRLSDGGRSLYGSALGAYAYDIPIPLQSGHIFALVVIFERYLAVRSSGKFWMLIFSGFLFLVFTWLMREVSMFRGFYIAGVMVAGVALLSRLKENVSLYWIILPIVVLQPLFRALGENRYSNNETLKEQGIVEQAFSAQGVIGSYWRFYDSGGDMTIFDTFVAARAANPAFRPYIYSWLYAPVHIVPRAIWKSKPERGILQDVSFMNGAPYAPGIAGFFVLDGGDWWMLGSMMLLGYLVAKADLQALRLQQGYLRCCLIAILSINGMFLTRFYLWQYFYQVLYAVIPCLLLAYMLRGNVPVVSGRGEKQPKLK